MKIEDAKGERREEEGFVRGDEQGRTGSHRGGLVDTAVLMPYRLRR